MRTCLSFILAIMLSLNAAYAASMGVCDALEHSPNHTATHFGHHSNAHSDDHDLNDQQVSADDEGKVTLVSDHYHDHVHPSFSYILPGIVGVMPLMGCSSLVANSASIFVSAPQVLLDRPPKAALA